MSKNLATTTVATAPSPATSGTSLTVATGTGSRLYDGMAVLHPAGAVPTAANAEIVSITVSGDVVTLTRAQESSTARTVVVGDILTQGITAAMWDTLVASNAGKAAASHVHSAADVTSGTLPLARGGTGGTDAAGARASLGLGPAATMTPATIAADPALTATYAPRGTAGNAGLAGPNTFTGVQDFTGATVTGLSGSGGTTGPSLARWRRKLATSPTSAKIAILGDSTSEDVSAAGYMYYRMRYGATLPGHPLAEMSLGTRDIFTDGVITSGSPVLTSATAAFTAADVGKALFPANLADFTIPTWVQSVDSPTQVTMTRSAARTQGGIRFTIGRAIGGFGYSGLQLGPVGAGWLADTAKQAALWSFAPDLVIASWLINDARLGQMTFASGVARLSAMIELIQTNLPAADILLRIPNPMLTSNVNGLNYVQDAGGGINPPGAAQAYSDLIRRCYYAVKGLYSNVDVIDMPALLFGTMARDTHPLLADQLHPTPGFTGGGYFALGDALSDYIGNAARAAWVATSPEGTAYKHTYQVLANGGGVGFLDLGTALLPDQFSGVPSAQIPLDSTFSVITDMATSPITLSGKTITRPFGGTGVRISGFGSTDFSASANRRVLLVSNGDGRLPSTGDRQEVLVDLPSIAAGATVTQTVAVTGVAPRTTAVLPAVGSSFPASGLILLGCHPTATDVVTLTIQNPTGSAVDLAASTWAFWVVR